LAFSYVQYTGNGTTTNYAFSFPYLSQSHVKVRVNGVLTSFTFLNSSTVTISPAPASGAIIDIRRETPKNQAPVDFADGSVLLEADLDLLATFNLYSAQEVDDAVGDSIAKDTLGVFQADGRRITNVGTPTQPSDAVTKAYADVIITTAAGSASAAAASANAAANSAASAATSYDNFDDRYLGQKATDPTLDNDGNALLVGAIYFNTAINAMKVYTGSAWQKIAPEQAIGTQQFTATAGQTTFTVTSGYNVTSVYVYLNGVLLDNTDFTATNGSTVVLASGAAVGDTLRVVTFYNPADTLSIRADAQAAKVAAEAAQVAAEAAYDSFDDRYLGTKSSDPTLDNDGNPLMDGALYFDTTVNVLKVYDLGNLVWRRTTPTPVEQGNINSVAANTANIIAVANNSTNINITASNTTNINAVAADANDIGTVASNIGAVQTLATDLAGSGFEYDLGSITDPATGPSASPDGYIKTVYENLTDINKVADIDSAVSAVAAIDTAVTTVANNIADVTNFADVYLGPKATDPTTRNDSSPLQEGDLYFNTASDVLKVYSGSAWLGFGALAYLNTVNTAQIANGAVTSDKLNATLDLGALT
jgi:hypothetical protein